MKNERLALPRYPAILLFLSAYIAEYGFSPTIREITENCAETSSTGATLDHLRTLRAQGYTHQPNPKRKQWALTQAGRDYVNPPVKGLR